MEGRKVARKSGFTLIELLVVVSIIGLLIGILLPALSTARKAAAQVKDGAQLREVQRGLITFSQNNRDLYPIPSALDKLNYTETGGGTAGQITQSGQLQAKQKQYDRTGAVLSILIYNGYVSPEQTVNPAEADGGIRPDKDFQFQAVTQAQDPKQALWDPGFVGAYSNRDRYIPPMNAGPATGPNSPDNPIALQVSVGNNSYAFQPLWGARDSAAYWSNTTDASTPVIVNRGPTYQVPADALGNANALYQLANSPPGSGIGSATLLIHGGKKTWEGNLVWMDNHVSFETSPQPTTLRISYTPSAGGQSYQVADNLFADETYETQGVTSSNPAAIRSNAYFRQWPVGIGQSEVVQNLETLAAFDSDNNGWGGVSSN
ncbi:MAG: type II secretion system protein [Phycisphaerales bacterium]